MTTSSVGGMAQSAIPEMAPTHRMSGQLWRFAVIGGLSTVVHLGLYWLFKQWWQHDQVANFVALLLATLLNTGLNRAWTFRVHGREQIVSHQAQGLVIFAITWVATAAALQAVAWWWPGASDAARTGVILVANALSTAARFFAMRWWIFTPRDTN